MDGHAAAAFQRTHWEHDYRRVSATTYQISFKPN
jgi:hypothetical protein